MYIPCQNPVASRRSHLWLWCLLWWGVECLGNSLHALHGTCAHHEGWHLSSPFRASQSVGESQTAKPRSPHPFAGWNALSPSISTFPCPPDASPKFSLPALITQQLGSRCPSLRGFQLMHSVIHQWRPQGQWGSSGQTSLSLCQQGMLEITRHTTLIDAARVYTPHFRQSEMAGINSLLLDGVCVWGRGGEAGEGGTRKYFFMIFSFKSIYWTLQSVMWQGEQGVFLPPRCESSGGRKPAWHQPTHHIFGKWCKSVCWAGRG